MIGSSCINTFTWTEEVTEKLRELWEKGLTGLEIAEVIGCPTRNAVLGKLHRIGLIPSGRGSSPLRSTKVRKMKELRAIEIAERRKNGSAVRRGKAWRLSSTVVPAATLYPPPLPQPRFSSWSGLAGEVDVIGHNECRYPLGPRYDRPTLLCKAPVIERSSYCEYHYFLTHRPSTWHGL